MALVVGGPLLIALLVRIIDLLAVRDRAASRSTASW